ncbi:uncharacterized protein M6B38_136170 [Iris pallida]|uniref:Uncharacterized protein n=1 Tax=Iris pallida TaxID=29817 RepID=A0AAX6FEX5_IRIPA|nr:uncharacterized protein M6B38_173305 [Iris pallida]KAJ6814077.1 uncharacterized protein M6B38_139290 [Iris pallida]KAJ6814957.1 uncharacterized protein M6B38_136170 [Iris pallida]
MYFVDKFLCVCAYVYSSLGSHALTLRNSLFVQRIFVFNHYLCEKFINEFFCYHR